MASALPKYLSSLGMDVSIFMPRYRRPEIESLTQELVCPDLAVPLGSRRVKGRVFKSEQGKFDIYFIDNPTYFWRENIYGTGKGEYLDNDERFIFFNRAVLEYMAKMNMCADVIHCNSWPTALIPVFLKTHYKQKSCFKQTATVLTLHNIAFQGEFPPESLALTGLNWDYLSPMGLALNGKFNFLKAGVMFTDAINTVSSSYKREILTESQGFGLENVLRNRKDEIVSIRNGVDYETWDPASDPYIAANYSPSNLKGKKTCKRDLIQEFGLSLTSRTPLVAVTSYLSAQKGIDILLDAVDELMKLKIGLVVLGQGEEKYETRIKELQEQYSGRLGARFDVSVVLTHKVTAGADILLIPSLYEPCGLTQLQSFRYGTVPIARATGGLAETVKPFNPKVLKGNGFVFKGFSSSSLVQAVGEALRCYRKPELWKRVVMNGFQERFSWKNAAKRYEKLYRRALEIKRGGLFV